MKIRTKIFLCIALIAAFSLGNFSTWINNELTPRYREAVEEPLVDIAILLANTLREPGYPSTLESLKNSIESAKQHSFQAHIYGLRKEQMDLRVYVTDPSGIVLYDSVKPENIGQDFSKWRDVYLTLRGFYGARTTRDNPQDPTSTVLYVAAPILSKEEPAKVIGILTVGKPTRGISTFIENARRKALLRALATLAVVTLFGLMLTHLLTAPLRKLTEYAQAVRDRKPVEPPNFSRDEMGTLGQAFEEMRESLEGKNYIERFVQSLTHELKSPVSGIQGAAELLLEDPPVQHRRRFLENIQRESKRIQQIVEKLLQLYSVEFKRTLTTRELIELSELLGDIINFFKLRCEQMNIRLESTVASHLKKPLYVHGDRFLLQQAINNLLENALEFTPSGGTISVSLGYHNSWAEIAISDNGPGIPDYALAKVFEKFFSLPRPDNGSKSSGLGLPFVKEVAKLHQGEISIENIYPHGVCAKLRL